MDWIRKAASAAFSALKQFIIPHLQKSGPDLAKVLVSYASQKAADYVKQSEQLGTSKGLVTQALLDLPAVVQGIVAQQLKDRFEPLNPDTVIALKEAGGDTRGSGNRQLLALSSVVDAMPYIMEEVERLQNRFDIIDRYGQLLNSGRTRDAAEIADTLAPLLADDYENSSDIAPIIRLVESMITSAIEWAEQEQMIPVDHPLSNFLSNTQKLCHCCNSIPVRKTLDDRLKIKVHRKPPGANALALLAPGFGEFDLQKERGGVFGAAAIASLIIPALIGAVPSMVTAVSDAVHTHTSDARGSGRMPDRSELSDVISNALLAAIRSMGTADLVNKRAKPMLKAPPSKRSRKN
ncbi:MAG: hypothetical protein ACRCXX_10215 [Cetobacterium sp.]|uniref:hypothetical protein n=1 Tax=Cetobacterium sp. TaxID=2071632 RepID=UPI003F3C7B17